MGESGTVTFLEFLLAAAWAGVVTAYILQRIAHRLLMAVVAMRAVYVAVVMIVLVVVFMVAVGAMDVGLLVHRYLLGNEMAGDYLAISRDLHVASEQEAGFHFASESIANRLLGFFQ